MYSILIEKKKKKNIIAEKRSITERAFLSENESSMLTVFLGHYFAPICLHNCLVYLPYIIGRNLTIFFLYLAFVFAFIFGEQCRAGFTSILKEFLTLNGARPLIMLEKIKYNMFPYLYLLYFPICFKIKNKLKKCAN